jgi:hypothetical protein
VQRPVHLELLHRTAPPLSRRISPAAAYSLNQQIEIARFPSSTHIIWAKKSQVIL